MGFFDDLKFPAPEPEEEDEFEVPEWLSPPEGWIGGVVPVQLLIARSERAAVFIRDIVAYPVGFTFTAVTVGRSRSDRLLDQFHFQLMHQSEEGEVSPKLMRLGIEYSDGRKDSNVGGMSGASVAVMAFDDAAGDPDPKTDLLLIESGGGGSGGRTAQSGYWVWPLPPPGDLTFVCEWPQFGIEESSIRIDADMVRRAAAEATQIWKDDDGAEV